MGWDSKHPETSVTGLATLGFLTVLFFVVVSFL